ncbi:DUF456 domain-containing protein [Luteimonas sp. e5]
MDTTTLLYLLAGLLVLVGIAGIILPALPGLPLVFAGLLLAAWADGFQQVHWGWMIPLGVLTALSLVVDFWATAMGAKRVGASRLALLGAVLGTLAGLFFMPFGILVGPFLGALIGELAFLRSPKGVHLRQALKVGAGTWLGIVLGMVLKLALAFTMLGLFALAWLIG